MTTAAEASRASTSLQPVDGESSVRPGHDDDRVLARGVEGDQGHPGGHSVLLGDPGHIDSDAAQALRKEGPVRVGTHAAHHRYPTAELCGRVGLVGSLSARVHREVLGSDRLSGRREALEARHQVHVQAAHHDDVRSHGAPGSSLRLR